MPNPSFNPHAATVLDPFSGAQESSSAFVAPLGAGYIVVWHTGNSTPSSVDGLYGQRYDQTGSLIGGAFKITGQVDFLDVTNVTALANGGFVVTWTAFSTGVFEQQFDASGVAVGSQLANPNFQLPDVVALASGGHVVLMQNSSNDIYSQSYDVANISSVPKLLQSGLGASAYVAAAPLIGGGYVLTWTKSGTHEVVIQRYNDTSVAVGSQAFLGTSGGAKFSDVAGLSDGGYVVVFETTAGIGVARYSSAGVQVSSSIANTTSLTITDAMPRVSALTEGGYVVSWSDGSGFANQHLHFRTYDGADTASAELLASDSVSGGVSIHNYVAGLANGGFELVWQGPFTAPGLHVYGQYYEALNQYALTTGADSITAGSAAIKVFAAPANLTSADNLTGGAGTDFLEMSAAGTLDLNQAATFSGFEQVLGSAGSDTIIGSPSRFAGLVIDAGAGVDTLSYATAQTGQTATLVSSQFLNFENLTGSAFDDTLTGNSGDNALNGGAGVDTVTYANASASVTVSLNEFGPQNTQGAGTDNLLNIENLIGSAFDDILSGHDYANNVLDGGDGIDTISYANVIAGSVVVDLSKTTPQNMFGNGTTDTLLNFENVIGGGFGDVFYGTSGNNVFDGRGGLDYVVYLNASAGVTVSLSVTTAQDTGGAGTDTLISIENLTGSEFNDTLSGNGGNNILQGASGIDTASYADATAGVTVNLAVTTAQATGGAGTDTITGFENLTGSSFNDTLAGDSGNNALDGGAGVDTLNYAAATAGVTVSLDVTAAQNTVGAGTDTLLNFENLTGSGFNDTLEGSAGDNTLSGGAGNDTASYASAGAGVTVSLLVSGAQNTGGAGTDTLVAFENLTGSAFGDTLTGEAGANILNGGLGSDVLYGVAGDDILRDGGETANRDFLYGGSGNDTYYVTSAYTAANEDLVYEGGTNPDLMAGVGDVDTIHSGGDFFWDYYSVGEVLYIDSSAGSPLLVGGKDVLNKTIYGGAGNDRVVTYGHNSTVDLGAGTDAVDFGPYGLDSSYAGQNTLVMRPGTGIDYIYNFHSGVDKVDLTAFHFGITGAQVLAQAVNVDNPGTANDYSYFYLTNAGGVNNFVVFMGLLGSQLQGGDFLT